MRNISDMSCTENQNTYFVHFFFLKIVPFMNMEKCGRAGQATDDRMAHARCMLDT